MAIPSDLGPGSESTPNPPESLLPHHAGSWSRASRWPPPDSNPAARPGPPRSTCCEGSQPEKAADAHPPDRPQHESPPASQRPRHPFPTVRQSAPLFPEERREGGRLGPILSLMVTRRISAWTGLRLMEVRVDRVCVLEPPRDRISQGAFGPDRRKAPPNLGRRRTCRTQDRCGLLHHDICSQRLESIHR